MKTKKSIFYCIALLMVGCLPSLHPLYNGKTLIFREELIGKWMQDDGGFWQFKRAGDKEYELRICDDQQGEIGRFSAHLIEIKGSMFIDLFPDDKPLKDLDDFYKIHILPVHTFMKVDQISPNLRLRMIDYDKVEEMIENDPKIIKHEVVNDDRIVLTAGTEELQNFVIEHVEAIFSDETDAMRLKPLYTDKDIIIDPNFFGHWKDEDGGILNSKRMGETAYELMYAGTDGTKDEIFANMLRHNNQTFLAVFTDKADLDSDTSNAYPFHLIPDFFLRAEQTKFELTLRKIKYKEACQILRDNTSPAQHQPADTEVIFRGIRIEPK